VAGVGGCVTSTPNAATIGGPAPYWQTFGFDLTGNRKSHVDHHIGGDTSKDITRSFTYPDPGKAQPHTLTEATTTAGGTTTSDSFSYDQTGNTETRKLASGANQALTFDAEGHLTSVTDTTTGKTSTYLYDADGGQLIRREPGRATLYLGYEEITVDTATNAVTGLRYYGTPGGGLTIVRSSSGAIVYKANDPHGTTQVTIDAATLRVTRRHTDPYGKIRDPQPGQWMDNRGFLGMTTEQSTGLTHIGARDYDPNLGRFISADPILVTGDPQQMNGYAYADNSPVTYSDPTGFDAGVPAGSTGAHSTAVMLRVQTLSKTYKDAIIWGSSPSVPGADIVCWGCAQGKVWVWEVKPEGVDQDSSALERQIQGGLSWAAQQSISKGMDVEKGPDFSAICGPGCAQQTGLNSEDFHQVVTVRDSGKPGLQVYSTKEQDKNPVTYAFRLFKTVQANRANGTHTREAYGAGVRVRPYGGSSSSARGGPGNSPPHRFRAS
jgi:RHS repeat-associated protein